MALIVQKFGGTSVADIDRIRKVGQIILKEHRAGHKLVIVVSAMAGVTNSLISKCSEISVLNSYAHMQEYDSIVGSGEILSSGLLALELQMLGLKSRALQAWQIPIITDDNFGSARVEFINSSFLKELVDSDIIPVITGFQGVTKDKQITTLGKGGSDTTAALIAAAINADGAHIYTDVAGIFTADPRIVHEAEKINYISTKMMLDLSSYGAKVLHPRAALAAYRYKFNIQILSSFEDNIGTLISDEIENEINMENRLISAITSNKNLLKIEIIVPESSFKEVIDKFIEDGLSADKMDITNNNHIKLIANLTDKNKFEVVLNYLQSQDKIINYKISSDVSTVTIVGYGIKDNNGLCFEIMNLLNQHNIQIKHFDVDETRFTGYFEEQDTEKAIKLFHQHFIQ